MSLTPVELHEDTSYPGRSWFEIIGPNGKAVVYCDSFDKTSYGETATHCGVKMSREFGEFLCRAANAHDKLYKAVVRLLELPQVENPGALPAAQLKLLRKVREQAQEALAAAGETPA